MPLKKFTLNAFESHRGKRLDQVLSDWLPEAMSQPVSKAKLRKLIMAGAVYLNGKRVRIASKTILPRARIDVYVDFEKLRSAGTSKDLPFEMSSARILFEDEFVIVVDKPAGLPTQPTIDESRDNLYAALKKFISLRDTIPQPYLGLHHRLDRDTSGVVLFTKDPKVNAAVGDLFSKKLAEKTYQALAKKPNRPTEPQWSINNYLGKIPATGKKARFGAVRAGGDLAHTDFRVLEELPAALLIEAKPRTGRTHQIRVHLAEAGMPIYGDLHYGGPMHAAAKRVMLHAACLAFPHPVTKKEIVVESPVPEDFLKCLEALRR